MFFISIHCIIIPYYYNIVKLFQHFCLKRRIFAHKNPAFYYLCTIPALFEDIKQKLFIYIYISIKKWYTIIIISLWRGAGMRINENLKEKPQHGHYTACLSRLQVIERFSKKILWFTIAESVVLFFFTVADIWMSALSFIPSLFDDPLYIFVQTAEIILLDVLAFTACSKYKISSVILFIVHCLIIIGCFAGGIRTLNTFPFLIGIIGAVVNYPSISAFLDYRQLTQTEGFPQFSLVLADADDNPEFISDYGEEYHKKTEEKMFIPVPEKSDSGIQPVSTSVPAQMDDIMPDIINTTK